MMKIEFGNVPDWAKSLPLAEQICASRGIPQEKLAEFLAPDTLHKQIPLADEFPAIEAAAQLLADCILKKKRILIWGDYDTDGIMAASILQDLIDKRTAYQAIIPERKEGYGVRMQKIQKLYADFRPECFITVDCGITSAQEVDWLKERQVTVIITDHHLEQGEKPRADCVVDPICDISGRYRYLCGAGVAWVLATRTEILLRAAQDKEKKEYSLWLLYAGIATIADVVPLGLPDDHTSNINRYIVRRTLSMLVSLQNEEEKTCRHKGLRRLMVMNERNQPTLASSFIAFTIAPCINASGRISSPQYAYQMIRDKSEEGAEYLIQLNAQRKRLEAEAFEEAKRRVSTERSVIALNVTVGLLGLIAGRLTEEREKPTIVVAKNKNAWHGSARAPVGWPLMDFFAQCKELLIGFGGHARAAGCRIPEENLEQFRERFSNLVDAYEDYVPTLHIDRECKANELTSEFLTEIFRLEPMGNGNPQPVFLLRNCYIKKVRRCGVMKQHLLFHVVVDDRLFYGKMWNAGELADELNEKPYRDIAFHLTEPFSTRKNPEIEVIEFVEQFL